MKTIRPKPKAKRAKALKVAKELLALVKGKLLNPVRGNGYIKVSPFDLFSLPKTPKAFQKALSNPVNLKKCEVCAIGATVVAYSRIFNKIRPDQNGFHDLDRGSCVEALSPAFTPIELEDMEIAFEEFSVGIGTIARNIIRNKGEYRP